MEVSANAKSSGPAAPRGGDPAPPRSRRRPSEPPLGPVPPSRPRSTELTALGWRMADGFLIGAVLIAFELLAVAAISRAELISAAELARATFGMFPLSVLVLAPIAIVAGAATELLVRAERHPKSRWAFAATILVFGFAAGFGVTGGRHLSGASAYGFAGAVALALGALAYFLSRPLSGWLHMTDRSGRRRLLLLLVGGFVCLELINAFVLKRLYPGFHIGLAVLAAAMGGLFTLGIDYEQSRGRRARLVRALLGLALFAVSAALSTRAASQLSRLDNVRFIYHERAPMLSQVLVLGASISPPAPLAAGDALPPTSTSSGPSLPIRGRDVLLITIDALRADHIGAYGYARDTSPNIDALAAEGVVFEAAYTPTPHTSYAVTSLLTGKYMRPLILQGLGADSETWATYLRRYSYRTAGFYPPAVFFIDAERFGAFQENHLGFEYQKVEFAPAAVRRDQVADYLSGIDAGQPVFLWVHLFEPHEPYEAHASHPFGDRDVDRYDSEIAAADAGVGEIVKLVRDRSPDTVVIVSADHGEEFGEHGGRYHGTTVYEEQVRVPLVISAKGALAPNRVVQPVQLIDLLPTVLAGLQIPIAPRIRGRDIGGLALNPPPLSENAGFAFAETDGHAMLALGTERLVCARRIGACALYDILGDPEQSRDIAPSQPAKVSTMRRTLHDVEGSHGRFELSGLRAEGKGYPEALRRGLSGDGDAATDVAALLDDADVEIRRKAAEVLFELHREDVAANLRLCVTRDEDEEVERWCAVALTRLGQGAARTRELLDDKDVRWRRLAALSLAQNGDPQGEKILIAWWLRAFHPPKGTPAEPIAFERARELAEAFGTIRCEDAVGPLIAGLDSIRLRPTIAKSLAQIGKDAARPALANRLIEERHLVARRALLDALVELGAGPELRLPLIRLLGLPDPLSDGLVIATNADLLQHVGGPRKRDLQRLRRFATSGVAIGMRAPDGGNGKGVRMICRARSTDGRVGTIHVGRRARVPAENDRKSFVPAEAPTLDHSRSMKLSVRSDREFDQIFDDMPASMDMHPGDHQVLVVYATQNVEIDVCAAVPRSDELPPPPPEPWQPDAEPTGLDVP